MVKEQREFNLPLNTRRVYSLYLNKLQAAWAVVFFKFFRWNRKGAISACIYLVQKIKFRASPYTYNCS